MHYTEIEMAESISTPTKISARNPVCRLCGGSYESRYMLRIFSKAFSRPAPKAREKRPGDEVESRGAKKKIQIGSFFFLPTPIFFFFFPQCGAWSQARYVA